MPLVSGEKLLVDARKRGYAVPHFNVLNLEMIDGVINTAEKLNAPVIIGIPDRHFPILDVESLVHTVKRRAVQTRIPVVLHLDHGGSWERIVEAIRLGFTSVMFDGSLLPIEENIAITKEVIHCAHAVNVSVEAELGHVGSSKVGDGNDITSVNEVVHFVNETKVDFLAISIGNTHGHAKSLALEFDVLEEIKNAIETPLVLHGGSDISRDDMRKLIAGGISKVNIFSEFAKAYLAGIIELSNSEKIDYLDLASYGKKSSITVIEDKFETFQTTGKAKGLEIL